LCVDPLLPLSRRPQPTKKRKKKAATMMIHQAATARSLLGRVADRAVVLEVVLVMVDAVESSGAVSSAMVTSPSFAR
jgi:hypothetical protein